MIRQKADGELRELIVCGACRNTQRDALAVRDAMVQAGD